MWTSLGTWLKALRSNKTEPSPSGGGTLHITVQLNARLMPMDRGSLFEDPLDAELRAAGMGDTDGGGTQLTHSGEVDFCDVEIYVKDLSDETLATIVEILERLGAPKGSKLRSSGISSDVQFGRFEGLAVYLNGTNLPADVYKNCDSNFVYSEFNRLMGRAGKVFSHWQGPTETALYLYGPSFAEMQAAISDFLSTYPLCQRCRVVQIA